MGVTRNVSVRDFVLRRVDNNNVRTMDVVRSASGSGLSGAVVKETVLAMVDEGLLAMDRNRYLRRAPRTSTHREPCKRETREREALAGLLHGWAVQDGAGLVSGTPLPGEHTEGECMTCLVRAEQVAALLGGRGPGHRWRDAAIQAKNDLRAIEAAFRDAESPEQCPIGPGTVFAAWASPAVTMRWIEDMERGDGNGHKVAGSTLRREDTPEARAIWEKVDRAAARCPQWVKDRLDALIAETER